MVVVGSDDIKRRARAAATDAQAAKDKISARHGAIAAALARLSAEDANSIAALAAIEQVATAIGAENDPVRLTAKERELDEKIDAAMQLEAARKALSAVAAAASAGDPRVEWEECRKTIDRFDKILVDMRKTAFGIITSIFSIAAVLFAVATNTQIHINSGAKVAVLGVISFLIVTAYGVDRVHQIWLEVAVKRAIELEGVLGFRITGLIGQRFNAIPAGAAWIVLYVALVLMGWIVFSVSIGGKPLSGHQVSSFAIMLSAIAAIAAATFLERLLAKIVPFVTENPFLFVLAAVVVGFLLLALR